MAEANPDNDSDLAESFERAAAHLQSLVSKLDSSSLLKAYGLYKQATCGPCNTPQPSWYQMQAKQKWEAWNELKETPPTSAMHSYVDLIAELDPEWDPNRESNGKAPGWVSVSSMADLDDHLAESDKTIFDYVKEGDIAKVFKLIRQTPEVVDRRDSEGMGFIHWAADRGNLPMMQCLVNDLKADVNLKDNEGQTALHYAAACGYANVVRFLLESRADESIGDAEGMVPLDVASDSSIKELFNISS